MTRRLIPRPSVSSGLLLGMTLSLLTFIVPAEPAHGQSARFDQFVEASPKAGEMAPNFTLLTLDNEPFDLMAAAAEKPVVIEFGSFT